MQDPLCPDAGSSSEKGTLPCISVGKKEEDDSLVLAKGGASMEEADIDGISSSIVVIGSA